MLYLIIIAVFLVLVFLGLNLAQIYFAVKTRKKTSQRLAEFEKRSQLMKEGLKKND